MLIVLFLIRMGSWRGRLHIRGLLEITSSAAPDGVMAVSGGSDGCHLFHLHVYGAVNG